eukprot:scaffold1389_cov122-Cylindrotheca_fusiformis.AAC.7
MVRLCSLGPIKGWRSIDGHSQGAAVRIPSSVTLISEFAFSKTTLRSVTLPLGLQSIGADAFSGCELLEFIDVPPTVSAIGEGAFASCNVLKRIRLPPTLKIIEKYLFFKCWWLEDIVIPDTVEQIREYAFTNCGLLSHVRLPPGNTIVAYDAFECCQSLISLETPRRGAVFDFRALMGCCSLVNFFQSSEQHRSVYLNHSKLAKLADSGADLLQKLKHRFDECPLHELCYYHSYNSEAETMEKLNTILKADPSSGWSKVDKFGLTALHVMALSQNPNLRMMKALMNGGGDPLRIIHTRDPFGYTPMDYIRISRMPNSPLMIRTLIQNILDRTRWIARWKSDVLRDLDKVLMDVMDEDFLNRVKGIGPVLFKIATYYRLEILSLMELFLWKIKIDDAESKESADRHGHRISSGASIVIPHVLQFLDKLEKKDYRCEYETPISF